MRFVTLAVFCLLFHCQMVVGQTDFSGKWNCHLECPGGQLKFGLVVETANDVVSAFITNGDEKIKVPDAHVTDNKLELSIEHYDSKIACTQTSQGLTGTWRKRRGQDEWVNMKFFANKAAKKKESNQTPKHIAGKWQVDFKKSDEPAVGIFQINTDQSVGGTFMTTTGDYRFLHGTYANRVLELSCFDGAHAFLFRASMADDETLSGDFWSSNTWHEKWTARQDDKAELPDAFEQTVLKKEHPIGIFKFPNLDGKPTSLASESFKAKAKLIYVFGSWCPNCHDAAAYFKELKTQFGDDLSIVGLAFELTGDFDRDATQVKRYRKRHDVDYPILIAGLADKKLASKTIPFLDKVRSYPTTIFLDSENKVHAIHTGFTGPATGESYIELKSKFESEIRKLLKSPK